MGIRKGQGYGVPKSKRARCPDCKKKGVSQWKLSPYGHGWYRECQYCGASWKEAGWALATAKNTADATVDTSK